MGSGTKAGTWISPTMLLTTIDYPLTEGITAFSTLRGTNDVTNPYNGFNVCHYTGDDQSHIDTCRELLCKRLNISPDRLIIPRQTHSSHIAVIDSYDLPPLDDTDGMVTNVKGLALCINTADCVPVLMADATAGIIAAVHSGWRGTVAGIAGKAVSGMVRMGAVPHRIKAVMGPSICTGCFEVGHEVAQIFNDTFPGIQTVDNSHLKPHIDLSAAIRATLYDVGVEPENISGPPACSMCNHSDYFSARRLGIKSGRTLSVIMLRT